MSTRREAAKRGWAKASAEQRRANTANAFATSIPKRAASSDLIIAAVTAIGSNGGKGRLG